MDTLRLGKSIKRITLLQTDDKGIVVPYVLYERRAGKKRGSRWLRPVERATRAVADANDAAAGAYLRLHKRSGRNRRDGWARDMPINLARATRKGFDQVSLGRLFNI